MSRTKVIAVFEQFPWLSKHFSQKNIVNASVSRMDLNFLGRPRYSSYLTIPGDFDTTTKIFLYDQGGEELTKWGKPGFMGMIRRFIANETIQQSLEALGEQINKCSHAVVVCNGCTITVYRLPKDSTLLALLRAKQNQAAEVLEAARQEVNES